MSAVYPNHARRRLAAGQLALGMILRQARTVDIATMVKTCGFDWFSIDMEHSAIDVATAAQIVHAALAVGVTPIVRVPAKGHDHVGRLLDAGAQGIIVPHIDTAAEAREVVAQCKCAPLGSRGESGLHAQLAYRSTPAAEAARMINEETLVAVMLETTQAVDNAAEIAAVPGLDVLIMGINDLCAEMGIPGQFGHPRVEEAFARVVAACRAHGVHPGMSGVHEPKLVQRFVDLGMRFIGGGTDQSFLIAGGTQRAAFLRSLLKG